jgi:hypothetical protein
MRLPLLDIDAYSDTDLRQCMMPFMESQRFCIAKQLAIYKWCQANNALE